jgi:prepilin-type N-terminal cleavage/methylation domain-containing protein
MPPIFSSALRIPLRPKRNGFTLIELLVVISIIAIVATAAFAAFAGAGRGTRLTVAGNTVSNLALLARQNSLAKNAMTALVMIGNAGTEGDYRTFALFEIVPRTDGEPAGAGDWRPMGTWETVPDGVVVEDCTFTQSTVGMTPPFPPLTFRGATIGDYLYVVFLPNGSLLRSGSSCVKLVAGYRPPGTQTVVYTAAKGTDGKAANYYQICLLAATGRAKIIRP